MKKIHLLGIALIGVIGVILAVGLSFQQNFITSDISVQNNNLGLVINPPSSQYTLQEIDQLYQDASTLGVGRTNLYMFWNSIEPQDNNYNFKNSDIQLSLIKKYNMTATLYFSIINGRALGPFPDWIGDPPIREIPKDKLVDVLDEILSRYAGYIDTVIIAGNTDVHFSNREHLIDDYANLYPFIFEKLKLQHPDVKFGNAFSLNEIIIKKQQHIINKLDQGDFVAFTYFPTDLLYEISKTPLEARADLDLTLKLVTNKSIILFESSWSTSDFIYGTQKDQHEFLIQFFEFYRENKEKIEHITWFRQYDRSSDVCNVDLSFFNSSHSGSINSSIAGNEFVLERLNHYICNSGLLTTTNEKKLAWNEFAKQVDLT